MAMNKKLICSILVVSLMNLCGCYSSQVVIKVFDTLGNEIETLVNEERPVGRYEITWYAEGLPSGVYFYRLRTNEFVETKKMILLKRLGEEATSIPVEF
jgi:hypothetical protein